MGKKAVAAWKKRRTGTLYRAGTRIPRPATPSAADGPESLARNIVRSFVLVVLPLLLIAAVIEGFITPHLR